MGSGSLRPADPTNPVDERVADGDLGTRVSRGLGWSLLGQAVSRIAVFAVGIALARILVPTDMGEVAAALLVVNVLMSINELGVIPAIVRCTTDVRQATATAATLAGVNSVLMYGVAFLVAPAVAEVTNTPGSVVVIRVMALSILIDGVVAVPLAMLYRRLRTVPQVLAEVLGMAGYALVAVVLAQAGTGSSSIAVGRVVGAVLTAGVMISVSWWPAPPALDLTVARSLLRFGLPLAVSSALFEAVMSIDYLIVGRELTGAALGVYLLAFNLSSWPVTIVAVSVGRVSFAGYSALVGEPERFVRGVVQSFAVALSCTLPLVAMLAVLAPETVQILYGSTWAEAVAPLRWLLVIGGLRVLMQLAGEVIAVLGHPGAVLRLRLIWLALLPFALVKGAAWGGLAGVGMGHVAVATVVIAPLFLRELARCGLPLRPLAGIVVRPLVAVVACLAAMAAASRIADGDLARLVVMGLAGGIAYTAVILPGNPVVARTWSQLRGDRPVSAAPVEAVA